MIAPAAIFETQSGLYCDAAGNKRELKRQNTPTDAPTVCTEGSVLDSASVSSTEVSDSPTLTQHQVIALCSELLDGFSTPSFQEKMQAALKKNPGERFVPARIEIALEVQQHVLPKYGLPGNFFGVVEMMEVIAPYLGSSTVLDLLNEADEKLGLPKHTTADMVKWQFPMEEEKAVPDAMAEFSRHQILSLCAELLDGFSTSEFQEDLRSLLGIAGNKRFVPGRVLACLRIQEKILPKYGLPGSELGVTQMVAMIAPFISDWWVRNLVEAIDEKLGLPRDTTANACYAML